MFFTEPFNSYQNLITVISFCFYLIKLLEYNNSVSTIIPPFFFKKNKYEMLKEKLQEMAGKDKEKV